MNIYMACRPIGLPLFSHTHTKDHFIIVTEMQKSNEFLLIHMQG